MEHEQQALCTRSPSRLGGDDASRFLKRCDAVADRRKERRVEHAKRVTFNDSGESHENRLAFGQSKHVPRCFS